MIRCCRAVTLLLLVLGLTGDVRAQSAPEIRGVVQDQTGGAIIDASVAITDADGHRTSTSTNWQGRFRLAAPPSSSVTLTVEAPGFAPDTRHISVPGSGNTTINFALRVAASTRVDVFGGLTGVSLDSGQNMSTITLSGTTLELLPDDPEGLLQTLRMLAGTTGSRVDQVAFYIDGAPLDRRLPPRDVIQSVRINANPFSAEFSEAGSNRVDIITKPASGQFHGEGRFDLNDSKLNARSPFEPVRPPVRFLTLTGYAGGPIQKGRWGLLAYGGGWRLDDNALVDATAINQSTLQPTPVQLNIPAPTRTTSFSVKSDALLAPHHILVVEYGHDGQQAANSGLQSGFDMPERAYASTSNEQSASGRLTSTISNRFLNEFRGQLGHHRSLDRAGSSDPAVLVLEGFNGGGNQDAQLRDYTTNGFMLTNVSTLNFSQHSLRFGGQLDRSQYAQIDRSNYNGTFTFGNDVVRHPNGDPVLDANSAPSIISALDHYRQTLVGTPGSRPSQFSIVRGNPAVTFPVAGRSAFMQDDWRVSSRMTVSLGARAEYQQELTSHLVFAPRVGLAYAPSDDGRAAVRAGFGTFYTAVPPGVVSDVLRSQQSEQFVINRPSFFPAVPATLPAAQLERTTRTEASDLTNPRVALSTISYDRQISSRLFGSVGYSWRHGSDLLRTRVLRTSAIGPTLQFESTGRSNAHELHLTGNGTVSSWLSVFSSYQLTRAFQDTDGPYTVPADSSAIAAEWGRALVPVHQVAAGASLTFFEDLSLTPFVKFSSALPFTITTGSDNNGDTQFADRPALADASDPAAIVTAYGAFDPNPRPGQTIVARNSASGPTEFTLDLSASWMLDGLFNGGDRSNVTLSVNNLTNRLNYAPFNGVLTSPFFGAANRALNPRRIMLTMRYNF